MRWLAILALLVACTHERVVNPLTPLPGENGAGPVQGPADPNANVRHDVSGDAAPGGVVHAKDGKTVDLATLWTKNRVVLVFYMGHWCPHCQKQLGDLNARGRDFDKAGAVVVAVSTDSTDDQTSLHDRLGLTFDLYSDPELEVIQKWGVADFGAGIAHPATFVIEPGGAISYRHIGKTDTDRPSTDEVLAALQNKP